MVAVLEPWTDVVTAATMVELVDGLVAEGRPGVGRLPLDGAAARLRARTAATPTSRPW